ncbi:MAG: hypothetical protein K1W26_16715 [Acetatifactor sp.]
MKRKKLILSMALSLCLCATPLSVYANVSTPIPPANTGDYSVSPQSDVITWRYMVENGKIYKRLYNASTGEYIGEWIYVGEYNP